MKEIYKKVYLKTDRNGTKYYSVTDVCPRCGGRCDYILGAINYGVCFLCGGTGTKEYTIKEYTPEYEAKLEANRKARTLKRRAEHEKYTKEHEEEILERRYADFGCGRDGIGYILTGNTFPVKDQIKENGGKWIYGVWICPTEIKNDEINAHRINLNGYVGAGSQVMMTDKILDIIESL